MQNHVCPWWLAYTFDNALRTLFHRPDQIFAGMVEEGMTVADIGCGMGHFSIGLAKIVKQRGKVIAADLQPKMLNTVENRARKAGLSAIIRTHRCQSGEIGIAGPVDFALASWMVHETPDQQSFLKQVHGLLKSGGHFLVTEPKFHVSRKRFLREVDAAKAVGFRVHEEPRIALSHAILLQKGEAQAPNSR